MKKLSILAVISMLAIVAAEGLCSPVLVSVELPTMENKKSWYQLKIPTYELIGNTAIAEADESQISMIKQKGYQINVINQQPDLTKYVVVSNIDRMPELAGNFIWKNDKTAIIKTLPKSALKEREYKHQIRPMNAKPLGDRFWESVTTKYVPLKNIPYDPFIQSLVDQVNGDSIASYIQRLQDFQTRVVLTDSSYAASAWIKHKFEQWGYFAQFDSLYIDTTDFDTCGYERNVIGITDGTFCPEKEYIVCGHFDTKETEIEGIAPGADDNASGTAGTMEIARIFKNFTWESTIKFIGWTAEEQSGTLGSTHYAAQADSHNIDINGVINMDMIGYMTDSILGVNVCHLDPSCQWLVDIYTQCSQLYIPALLIYPLDRGVGDDLSFAEYGYPSLGIIEYPTFELGNPNYHASYDLLSTLSPELFVSITKASIATIGVLGIYPSMVKDVAVTDPGDEMKLVVNWTANSENDITGYWIYYGTQSEEYTDSNYVSGISTVVDTIDGLSIDSTYYFVVRAQDSDGHKSPSATETTGWLRPYAPSGGTATPLIGGVHLTWQTNTELDIAGYNIYRKINDGGYDSLASTFDTSYVDSPLSGANRYYYKIRAYDNDGNYSALSDSVYGRPITLDQGVLVVDETNNWTIGSYPRDIQQDSMYDYIFSDYKHEQYEYGSSAQKPILADFGPYSTVAWFADDYTTLLASEALEDLQVYLENGGKLWFTGWKPTGDIRNDVNYAADFVSGSFIYDYLKVSHVSLSAYTDSFQAASGLLGYPLLNVDPLRVPLSTWLGTMRYIESLTPVSPGEGIYAMDMKNDTSPYEGQICAVRDSGKTVLFGFPIYFMDKDQAKAAAQQVMAEFGEPSGVSGKPDNRQQITDFRLYQNAPNPFNRLTTINYQLPKAGQVKLNIYNIAGQLVKTLVNQEQPAGSYTVKWDKRDNLNRQVSAGVYIYQLTNGERTQSRKMIVLK